MLQETQHTHNASMHTGNSKDRDCVPLDMMHHEDCDKTEPGVFFQIYILLRSSLFSLEQY